VNIDLSDLNAGMYFITVHNNGKTESTKFLKN
ncbi:MAG: T9SS type A sorting domain-containing protein, partial [Bacteroidetes bacterium]|nr:T9SS type A sorting domain-containing protein [Bacteroidota bacterium]